MHQIGSSRIVSVGKYLPIQRIRPQQMISDIGADKYGISPTVIEDTLGINELRHAKDHEKPSDLAVKAAQEAISSAKIPTDHIDLIIFCGIEGDYAEPSTAHYIQHQLGLSGVCFDISNACLGFMSGLQVANDMISCGSIRNALVCTGEKPSVVSHAVIRKLKHQFSHQELKNKLGMLSVGDAGGAVIVGPGTEKSGFVNICAASNGKHSNLCFYKLNGGNVEGQMLMGKICALTINLHEQVYAQCIQKLQWPDHKIDLCITHQVGIRPFEILANTFNMTRNKMADTFSYLGNLTSATLPVNLSIALENKLIQSGSAVYIALSGSGISVAHAGLVI